MYGIDVDGGPCPALGSLTDRPHTHHLHQRTNQPQEAATAAALAALAASSEQSGPEIRLARFLHGAGGPLLQRLEAMGRAERSAWGQEVRSERERKGRVVV